MDRTQRDISVLEHIVKWCDEIAEAHVDFGDNYEVFQNNKHYFKSVAMSLLQIGELINHLSKDFQEKYPQIPYSGIISLRNVITHGYGSLVSSRLWETSHIYTIELQKQCLEILEKQRLS
jgi:uncharacterized protein with HEPN domain